MKNENFPCLKKEPQHIYLKFFAAQMFRERNGNSQRLNLWVLHKFEILLGQCRNLDRPPIKLNLMWTTFDESDSHKIIAPNSFSWKFLLSNPSLENLKSLSSFKSHWHPPPPKKSKSSWGHRQISQINNFFSHVFWQQREYKNSTMNFLHDWNHFTLYFFKNSFYIKINLER
jgi:hypothetical protein